MNTAFESQMDSRMDDATARVALGGVGMGARAKVVNRTHRVVRQRAMVMQARRNRTRGLMLPMIICSVLLILTAVALWSGLYQYQAVEAAAAVQADVAAALASSDANDHLLVVLLWFVPVVITVLGMVVVRRTRSGTGLAR